MEVGLSDCVRFKKCIKSAPETLCSRVKHVGRLFHGTPGSLLTLVRKYKSLLISFLLNDEDQPVLLIRFMASQRSLVNVLPVEASRRSAAPLHVCIDSSSGACKLGPCRLFYRTLSKSVAVLQGGPGLQRSQSCL